MAKIVIDAGHGGFDNGASYKNRLEKNDNLDIALAVGQLLEEAGEDVAYTRTTDRYDSPTSKAGIGNAENADYFISIHRNAAYAPNTYSGVQTLIYDENGIKKVMADAINHELGELGFMNLGTEVRTDLAVLKRTNAPALLVEVGFIDNDADNIIFEINKNEIAAAIAEGILRTLDGSIYEIDPTCAVSVFNYSAAMPDRETACFQSDCSYGMPVSADNNSESSYGMPVSADNTPGSSYRIQVGLFRVFNYAKNLQRELTLYGFDTEIAPKDDYYYVSVLVYGTLDYAKDIEYKLKKIGYDTLLSIIK